MELLWDVRVSLDLFLGGVGIGAFIFGAFLFYIDKNGYQLTIKRAMIISPLLIIVGLLLLLSELGRPLNVIKTIVAVNPTSFMSIGIFLQGIFIALVLYVVFNLLTKKIEDMSGALIYVTATLAGLVGFYHGFLLTGIGLEAWNQAIPIIFFGSSILSGAFLAASLSYGSVEFEKLVSNFNFVIVANAIITIELIAILGWVYSLATATAASQATYAGLMSLFGFELFLALAGLLLPLLLLTLVLMKKISLRVIVLPTAILLLGASFVLKNLIVYLGQMV
ncbi:MAG: polysulfide reductase NrfD [Campylobacteraceae bacterium]|nr:polysulfide reductase NrfD [Campylobacteraceae bacterium]